MLHDPKIDFPPPIQLRGDTGVRVKGGLLGPAKLRQVLQDRLIVGVVRIERAEIGEPTLFEKGFGLVRHLDVSLHRGHY